MGGDPGRLCEPALNECPLMSDPTELLHRAARALAQNDPASALALVRQALTRDLSPLADRAALVRAALPELERRTRAAAVGEAARWHPDQPAIEPGLLTDVVDRLRNVPEGQALFAAAERGDALAAKQALAVLAGRHDLPPALAHHLALLYLRAALFLDERDPVAADVCWRLSWHGWLRWASDDNLPAEARALLLKHLLGLHRRRIGELLAGNRVDHARRHWGHVQRLAPVAPELVACFRDELATDYLLATREAMRFGVIPEGWRADYEKGLTQLRRLLSLDRDNVRLLTALVEICGEWFLDCYNNNAAALLWEQVERFTPFALQLARLTEQRPGDLAARAAVAEFHKFRGFVAFERERKVALYREALRFNPANDNVRQLLTQLEEEPS